jgi:hypothetical protein
MEPIGMPGDDPVEPVGVHIGQELPVRWPQFPRKSRHIVVDIGIDEIPAGPDD